MRIRALEESDRSEWLRLRCALWPDAPREDLESELEEYVSGSTGQHVLVAPRPSGGLCGLIELSIRPAVSGCDTKNVGYIEGWFVDADVRRQGIGRSLVRAGEDWARALGCVEMASDTEIENTLSQEAHKALGYRETERVVMFARRID